MVLSVVNKSTISDVFFILINAHTRLYSIKVSPSVGGVPLFIVTIQICSVLVNTVTRILIYLSKDVKCVIARLTIPIFQFPNLIKGEILD